MEYILQFVAILTFGIPAAIAAFLASRRFGLLAGFVLVIVGKFALDKLIGLDIGFGVLSASNGAEFGLLLGWGLYWGLKIHQSIEQ